MLLISYLGVFGTVYFLRFLPLISGESLFVLGGFLALVSWILDEEDIQWFSAVVSAFAAVVMVSVFVLWVVSLWREGVSLPYWQGVVISWIVMVLVDFVW